MDSTLACLEAWMGLQRWYTAKGRRPSLRAVARWELDEPADAGARVVIHLVADVSAVPETVYQVPVVERETATVDVSAAHVIGSPVPGTTLVDGPFDPAFTSSLERLVTAGGRTAHVIGHALGRGAPREPRTATVLSGEQSNTSIVYRGEQQSIICKVFRQVHPGLSPDIELSSALSDAGSPHVPRAIGALEGTWQDPAHPDRTVSGSLAFAQEFLTDVEDEWRVALRAAAAEEEFGDEAEALGRATARVHATLAQILPTRPAGADDIEAASRAWTRRLVIAGAEVAEITELTGAIQSVYDAAREVAWPGLQRIHGDLHLGQVLQVAGRGCVLLDFEGEPLRPMRERVQPDLALRDVAGVLRSFDYVAGSVSADGSRPRDLAHGWAQHARRAFLDGYSSETGVDIEEPQLLLVALELDKAVYECIYEARNRPDWLGVPLAGVQRLVALTRTPS